MAVDRTRIVMFTFTMHGAGSEVLVMGFLVVVVPSPHHHHHPPPPPPPERLTVTLYDSHESRPERHPFSQPQPLQIGCQRTPPDFRSPHDRIGRLSASRAGTHGPGSCPKPRQSLPPPTSPPALPTPHTGASPSQPP